jgi:hypothetical protein
MISSTATAPIAALARGPRIDLFAAFEFSFSLAWVGRGHICSRHKKASTLLALQFRNPNRYHNIISRTNLHPYQNIEKNGHRNLTRY